MPKINAKTMAPIASSTVAPNRAPNTSSAGVPGATPVDVPKSPRSIRPRYLKYWTKIGWSSPSAVRSAATFSGVARSPSRAVTVPPGRDRSQMNSSNDSANSATTSCNSRRIVYRSTTAPSATKRRGGYHHEGIPAATLHRRPGSAGDRHRVELLVGQRARGDALHLRRENQRRWRMRNRDGRQPLAHELLVQRHVELVALRRVRLTVRRLEVGRQRLAPGGGLGREPVRGAGEERADEIVRRVVVAGPAQQEQVGLLRLDTVQVATVPRLGRLVD